MPTQIPLFPLGTVLFPGMPIPLHIFEPRYRQLMRDHGEDTFPFGVSLIHSAREPQSTFPSHDIGTAALVTTRHERPDGRWDIVAKGERRFRILDVDDSQPYAVATVEWIEEELGDPTEAETLLRIVGAQFHRYAGGVTRLTKRRFVDVSIPEDPIRASYDLGSRLPLHTWERQRLLQAKTAVERLSEVSYLAERELALLLRAGAAGLALNHPGGMFSLN
jgi:Lon protease-like protein